MAIARVTMVEEKNIQEKRFVLGQYFTRPDICRDIVGRIDFTDAVAIEPSFGSGNFVFPLAEKAEHVIGVELDASLYDASELCKCPNVVLYNKNFYDFKYDSDHRLVFVGNPPYRTPAYSLSTHKAFISALTKRYNVLGIREEAVFFILHTIDLILRSRRKEGEIHYIVPLSIVKNNSKFFQRFKVFLKERCEFLNVTTIRGNEFDNVAQDLICLSLRVGKHGNQANVIVDGKKVQLEDFLCLSQNDIIPFQKIFKRTYLGSVPCESVLMSISGESREHFKDRLCAIISDQNLNKTRLYKLLQYKGKFHLKLFEKHFEDPAVQSKLDIILSYVVNMREKEGIISEFRNIENYKEINGRHELLYYFRCARLKEKKNFVYELNPNPCPSFYFTGNPSHSSSDYFGFCNYDVNRNVSPGANRTVPIANIDANLTDFFKAWWRSHTNEPFSNIFEYIQYIASTSWYKRRKENSKRFYFGIPAYFVRQCDRRGDFDIPDAIVDFGTISSHQVARQELLPL